MENYLAIVNKKPRKIPKELRKKLKDFPGDVVFVKKEKDIVELIKENWDPQKYTCIFTVGGDGTSSAGMAGASECGAPVYISPLGTGNDLPASLVGSKKLSKKQKKAYLRDIVKSFDSDSYVERPYDMIEFTYQKDGKEFKKRDGLGLHGELFARSCDIEKLKYVFGSQAYIFKGLYDMIVHKPQKLKVKLTYNTGKTEEFEDSFWAFQLANTPTTGGGKVWMKGVQTDDGTLDFVYIRESAAKKRELPGLISDLKDMLSLPQVEIKRGVKAIEIEGDFYLAHGGEPLDLVNYLSAEVKEGAVIMRSPLYLNHLEAL